MSRFATILHLRSYKYSFWTRDHPLNDRFRALFLTTMKFLVVFALIISAVLVSRFLYHPNTVLDIPVTYFLNHIIIFQICQANVNGSVDVDVEVTVPDPLDFINNVSHSLFEVYKASVAALRKRCLGFANEVKSDAADVASNIKSDVANIANDVKSDISNVANDVVEVADQAMVATLDALKYMQDEVNFVTADFQLAVDKLSDFIDQALRAGNEKIQDVKQIWDALRHSTRRLTRDINKLRSYVIDKVKAISKKFGRETKEFRLAMKELYMDVQRKMFYEIRRTWSVFKDALQLPLENYFEVNLQVSIMSCLSICISCFVGLRYRLDVHMSSSVHCFV